MDLTERLLKSTHVRLAALAIGFLSGSAKLLDFIFAAPIVQAFATIGLFTVILYFVFVILYRIIGRSEDEKVYQIMSKRYGMSYDLVEVDCTIKENGSAIVQRTIDVRAYSNIEEVDNFMLIGEKDPDGNERDIRLDRKNVKSLSNDHTITIAPGATGIRKEFGRLSAVVAITPPLKNGDSMKYQLIEHLDEGLFAINLTPDQINKRKSNFDYFGWNINRPTQKLIIRVFFPINYKPEFFRDQVRYASVSGFPSDRTQKNEELRLKKPSISQVDGGRYVLNQEIDFPMIGLIYILRWQPVALSN